MYALSLSCTPPVKSSLLRFSHFCPPVMLLESAVLETPVINKYLLESWSAWFASTGCINMYLKLQAFVTSNYMYTLSLVIMTFTKNNIWLLIRENVYSKNLFPGNQSANKRKLLVYNLAEMVHQHLFSLYLSILGAQGTHHLYCTRCISPF